MCSNPSNYVSEYLLASQSPKFVQDRVNASDEFSRPGMTLIKMQTFPDAGTIPISRQPGPGQPFTQPLRPTFPTTSNSQAYRPAPPQQTYQHPPPSSQRTPSFKERMLKAMVELKADSQVNPSLSIHCQYRDSSGPNS